MSGGRLGTIWRFFLEIFFESYPETRQSPPQTAPSCRTGLGLFTRFGDGAIETLFEAGGFPDAIAEVVQFGPTGFTATDDVYITNSRGMKQEHPFNADALEDAAHGDGFIDATIAHGDNGPFVGLNPLFAAFLDDDTNADGVTDIKFGEIGFEILRFDRLNDLLTLHSCLVTLQPFIIDAVEASRQLVPASDDGSVARIGGNGLDMAQADLI